MKIQESYNIWSKTYDNNNNKTRDLEAQALKKTLKNLNFQFTLEVGCGTGKNTNFLLEKSKKITAVDFSENMLEIAKNKIKNPNVDFKIKDITKEWNLPLNSFDFISFSLILEHIENLDFIFHQVNKTITKGGYVYIGELHPYKQYSGSKARFETEEGMHFTTCFTHNISDFIQIALKYEFKIIDINEFFDDDNLNNVPRILSILLQKQ